jgi:phage shock protein A
MGILKRIFNLFKAKTEKAVKAAEANDPVALIELELKKADEQATEYAAAVTKLGGNKISLEKRYKELVKQAEQWGKNAETALREGNEELASTAIDRQTQYESEAKGLKVTLDSTTSQYEKMKDKVKENKTFIDTKRRELSTLDARFTAAKITKEATSSVSGINPTSAASRMEDLGKMVDQQENEMLAAVEIEEEASGADVEKQFADMAKKANNDEKLAALKAKMAAEKEDK